MSTVSRAQEAGCFLPDSQLHINEIASANGHGFHDADGDSRDWIELFNAGETPVNLEGYEISSNDADWSFPSVSMGPSEYLIVFASAKNRKTGELHTNFELSDKGEAVTLKDSAGRIVSSVLTGYVPRGYTFGQVEKNLALIPRPSPGEENAAHDAGAAVLITKISPVRDGGHFAIELVNYGRDAVELEDYLLAYQGKRWSFPSFKMASGSAVVLHASGQEGINPVDGELHAGLVITPDPGLLVLMNAEDIIVDQVFFNGKAYARPGPVLSKKAVESGLGDGDGGTCPARNAVVNVLPYTRASTAVIGGAVPVVVKSGGVVINEVVSTFSTDWIELKNTSSQAVDISGHFLTDNFMNITRFAVPPGTVLAAGAYVVFEPFDISSGGETIIFSNPQQNELDRSNLPELVTGTSYARIPDGTGNFKIVNSVTRGAENRDNTTGTDVDIVINEVMADNVSFFADEDGDFEDWIELKNRGAAAVNLAGYWLVDEGSAWQFPEVAIPAGGYLLVWASDKNKAGPGLHTNFKIAKAGEPLWLLDADEQVVDNVITGNMLVNHTQGRFPDGLLLSWQDLYPPTPLAANRFEEESDPPGVFLRINEIMADNRSFMLDEDGDFPDWLEIKNIGDHVVALGGFALSDGHASWTFGETTIEVGERVVVRASGKDRTGVFNHANFTLPPTGGRLVLNGPLGELIDHVDYGPMAVDRSRGGFPDGARQHQDLNPPTPWLANRKDADPGADVPARLTGPALGSVISSTQVTFSWSAGSNADAYFLSVANTPDLLDVSPYGDIFAANVGLRTSQLVAGIPLSGKLIYVRLWSKFDNQWVYNDYAFQVVDISEKSRLVLPAEGSVISRASSVFQWTKGKNVQENYLGVGTSFGAVANSPYGDIFAKNVSGILQINVDNIPLNAGNIFVRLWSRINGRWVFNDYQFATQPPAPPQLISPAPGSEITSTEVMFRWSPGPDVSAYFLGVGTTPQSLAASPWGNIAAANLGAAEAYRVSGIPLNGRPVYARLWYKVVNTWYFLDYTFSTSSSHVRPVIVSPAPGSPLSSSMVTFNWSPGSGASSYFLGVGTTPSSVAVSPWGNIFAGSTGLSTSKVVNGIPLSGAPVYVRLWHRFDGVWYFDDYVYQTQNLMPGIISPVPGSSLPSSSVTFSWTPGQNVEQYFLGVGTTQAAVSSSPWGDIFNGTPEALTSHQVSGIPQNGNKIYVRLWYKVNGIWFFNDYMYN